MPIHVQCLKERHDTMDIKSDIQGQSENTEHEVTIEPEAAQITH